MRAIVKIHDRLFHRPNKVKRSQSSDSHLISLLRVVEQSANAIVILVGGVVLLGWMFDIAAIHSFHPGGLATMKVNSALCFLLSGASLWLGRDPRTARKHGIAQGCAFAVTIVALLTIAQYLFAWNLGIDELLFRDISDLATSHPGRMGFNTAFNFLLVGGALLFLDKKELYAQILTLLAALVAFQALIGYGYHVEIFYRLNAYATAMALHTALTFIVLCAGILCKHPDRALMSVVTSSLLGGQIARRLLVAAIAIPLLLGWLSLKGQKAGYYDPAFAISLLVVAIVVIFAFLIWQTAYLLNQIDRQRREAERGLRESEERYRAFIEQSSEAIWRFELEKPLFIETPEDEQVQHFYRHCYLAECNNVMAQMYGYSRAEEIVGARLENFLMPSDPNNIEYLRAFIASGYRIDDAESHEFDREGNSKYFLNNLVGIVENGVLVRAWGTQRDITDRKHANEALRRSESQMRLIADALPALIAYVDSQQRYRFNNKGYQDWFGYSSKDLYGKHIKEVLGEAGYEIVRPNVEAVLSGQRLDFESVIPYKQGGHRYVNVAYVPDFGELGEVRGYVALIRDISQEKEIQQALQESEKRLRRLVESNIFGVAFGDFSGKINYANDYFLQMVGYDRDDLLTGKMRWDTMTPPEFLHLDLRGGEELKQHGVANPFEKEYIRKDGSRVPVLIGGALLQEPYEKQEEIICFYLDLTDRKRAREALEETNQTLQALIRACPLAIAVFNLDDGKVKMWNPAAEKIFGWSEVEALGNFMPSIAEETRVEFLAHLQAIRSGKSLIDVETKRQKKDGSSIDISIWATPVRDAKGNTSCMSIVADISDRKALEEERTQLLSREQAARAQAEAVNRLKDEFLATLSHELRTPLNAMLGWSHLLHTRKLDEATTNRALETIYRNTKSLNQLIEEVLDVSRIITGKLRINLSPMELLPAIEAAIDTILPAAEAKKIQLKTKLDSSVLSVLADATRLQQIIWNLLSNAVKFTPSGGKIEVELLVAQNIKTGETKGEIPISKYAQIKVSDTGIGISQEFLPYVFDRFTQADGTMTRTHGGLGLGLAIARHLIEIHGGTLSVESLGLGKGATFIIELPLLETTILDRSND